MILAKKIAAFFAATEFAVTLVLGAIIIIWTPREPEAAMLWIFLFVATYPASALEILFHDATKGWHPITFLPGIAGDWPNFLSPLLFFCTVGAAWWWLVGYLFGRLYSALRSRSQPKPAA